MTFSLDAEFCLKKLADQFTNFRQQSPRTKIPKHLRRAVLDALDSGIELSLVVKALGLTGLQVARWRRQLTSKSKIIPSNENPRVLEVVPSQPATSATAAGLRVSYEVGRLVLEFSF